MGQQLLLLSLILSGAGDVSDICRVEREDYDERDTGGDWYFDISLF